MNSRPVRLASARILLVAAMSLGVVATFASAASASTNNWYVSTTGSNANNNCSASNHPCATLQHALVEQAASATTGTINVAAGTYVGQAVVCTGNDNVVIKGASESSTTLEPPAAGLASDSDTDTSNPQFYVIDVCPGTTGILIEKLTVNGLNANSFFDNNGDGCSQSFVGVYFHESSGTLKKVEVTGIDMPPDEFGCQGGTGIYVNSDSADPAVVSIKKVSLTAPAFTATTSANLPSGTYPQSQHEILPVSAEPAGYTGGDVLVGGYEMAATPDNATSLYVSGTVPATVPSGSTVNYNPYTPAYDKNGIACDDDYTTCTIVGSTVEGVGPNNAIGQNGILAWGAASVTIGGATAPDANTITGDSWTGGGYGNSGSGILLLNGGTFNVVGNNVSNSDVDIYAGEVQAYGIVDPNTGTWTINANTVSGATDDGLSVGQSGYGAGIQLDSTTNNVEVTNNNVSGSGVANILLTGASNATIGGLGSNQGNHLTGSAGGAGIVVGGPGSECIYAYGNSCAPGAGNPDQFSSTGDSIFRNHVTGNGAGLVMLGQYNPAIVGQPDPDASYSNEVGGNTWSNIGFNVGDFGAYNGTPPSNVYGTPSADSCEPTLGGSAFLGSNYYGC